MEIIHNKPNKIAFSDISFAMLAHPITKDLSLNTNETAIKNSIKNLLLTKNYEKPFHPEIGSNIYGMLFEPLSPFVSNYLEAEIHSVLTRFEPRIKLSEINVISNIDSNGYEVTISFYIVNQTTQTTITIFLEKLR